MRALLRLVSFALFAWVWLVSGRAMAAEKVAILPFMASGSSPSTTLDAARGATSGAAAASGFTLATESELLSAKMASQDGVPDTSEEYRAAGRASGSQWTVAGRVAPREGGYRLELEVCQVGSGRVESLARDIDPNAAQPQIQEMLALLLRPEGIANADIPWQRAQPKPVVVEKPPPPPQPAGPPPPPPVSHPYAEGHPLALGVGGMLSTAAVRPANAAGSPLAILVEASGGYALDAVPGLELRADVAGSVSGPGSVVVDAGGRYAFGIVPTARIYAGPEIMLGVMVPTAGDKSARFYARGSAVLVFGLGDRAQLELSGDVAPALGSSTLVLVGGTLRGLVRF